MEEPDKVAVCGKKDCVRYVEQDLYWWGWDSQDKFSNLLKCNRCTEFTGLNLYEAKKDG